MQHIGVVLIFEDHTVFCTTTLLPESRYFSDYFMFWEQFRKADKRHRREKE